VPASLPYSSESAIVVWQAHVFNNYDYQMLTLRPAVPADTPLILDYIRELAEFEREPEAAVATEADIHRYAFEEHPLVWVTMAEWDGQPAGFALWFLNFSTWEGKPGIYLEDLFVRPPFRGHGIGKALLKHLAALAAKEGWTRFVWQVLDWNTPAIDFYVAHGARLMRSWLTCRVEGEAIAQLAEMAD
jgi:GNAT superfamily N-acetyltransferase